MFFVENFKVDFNAQIILGGSTCLRALLKLLTNVGPGKE